MYANFKGNLNLCACLGMLFSLRPQASVQDSEINYNACGNFFSQALILEKIAIPGQLPKENNGKLNPETIILNMMGISL
ncbi:MAG: hypothetical protein B1H11_00930 [Desulfobacteraceae bacterium 4484_190.1]|nr:MAG: hypothetical protein B1H11_00930 [Desulfobacteraceae bacterium 4484_190.1]